MLYGCSASPSEKAYGTVNDSPEAITFSYEITTTPVPVSGVDENGNEYRPTASIEIDSTRVNAAKLKAFEDILYGTTEKEPRLPLPDELKEIFGTDAEAEG